MITELEACISLLPAVSGNTNIQVEIALAMQPLRSENAQLRRYESFFEYFCHMQRCPMARTKVPNELSRTL